MNKSKSISKPKNKEIECCFKNIDKAIRIGRCNYICPKCKKDVSLLLFFYQQAITPINVGKNKGKKK